MNIEMPRYSVTNENTTQTPLVTIRSASEQKSKVKLTNQDMDAIVPASYSDDFIECGMNNVTDGIGDHYKVFTKYDYKIDGYRLEDERKDDDVVVIWQPMRPVFVSAQTGQGKNYFIENTLLPYIRELNHKQETRQKVLILSNRIALTIQMKDRLKQGHLYQDTDEESKEYSYSKYNNILGSEYADVLSYQGCLNRLVGLRHEQGFRKTKSGNLKMTKQPKYLFVICDEAHFFTSDSMFNPYTDRILANITRIFSNSIRVYMTATPFECIEHIQRHERAVAHDTALQLGYYPSSILYGFNRDYRYLDIKYYTDFDELKYIIEHNNNDNWLVFIDDKKQGASLKEQLEDNVESLRGKVYAVSSDSKSNINYQNMVVSESINVTLQSKTKKKSSEDGKKGTENKVRVLIATSVIDNGVNFRNIQNIVISDISRVKCLQMVGRARVDIDNGERVTLYIKRFNKDDISSRIDSLRELQGCYHDFKTLSSGNFIEKHILGGQKKRMRLEHWLGADKERITHSGEYLINEIADSLVKSLVPSYETILGDILQELQNDTTPGQKYLEHMLSWFGHVYDVDSDITYMDNEKGKKAFVMFLEKYVNDSTRMNKDEQENFISEFIVHATSLGVTDKNKRIYAQKVANGILKETNIGFKIISNTKDKPVTWSVVRHNWIADGELD